jgi:hypothetical protein
MERTTCDEALTLLTEARAADIKLKAIALAAGVPYSWLVRFARGDFDDPGSRKVERIHRYLSARKLIDAVPLQAGSSASVA